VSAAVISDWAMAATIAHVGRGGLVGKTAAVAQRAAAKSQRRRG